MKSSTFAGSVLLCLAFATGGCGNNVNDLIFQSITAVGNTALDLLLTEFANQIADHFDDRQDDDDNGDDELPDGDPVAGQQAFVAGGCGACHGENAEGGTAPTLAGMNELAALAARFGDGGVHFSRQLSEQDIEDVATWLLTLGSNGDLPDGDPIAGQQAYTAVGCAACHGADGEGGSAPALADMNKLAALEARFAGGASHLGTMLDAQDIVDVATWLLGDVGNGGVGEPDPIAGQQTFLDSGCNTCHGAAAGGGVGPTLAGMDKSAELDARFGGGASHFGRTLSNQDVANVAAWLLEL